MAKTTREIMADRRERAIRAFQELKAEKEMTDWKAAEYVAHRQGWSAVGLRRVLVDAGIYATEK